MLGRKMEYLSDVWMNRTGEEPTGLDDASWWARIQCLPLLRQKNLPTVSEDGVWDGNDNDLSM